MAVGRLAEAREVDRTPAAVETVPRVAPGMAAAAVVAVVGVAAPTVVQAAPLVTRP